MPEFYVGFFFPKIVIIMMMINDNKVKICHTLLNKKISSFGLLQKIKKISI